VRAFQLAEGLATVVAPSLAAVPTPTPAPRRGKAITDDYSAEKVPFIVASGGSVHLSVRFKNLIEATWPDDPIGAYLWLVQGFQLSPDKNPAKDICPREAQLKEIAKGLYRVDPAGNPAHWPILRRHLMKALLNGVKYVGEEIRWKYLVDVESAVLMRRNIILDTFDAAQKEAQNGKHRVLARPPTTSDRFGEQARFLWVLQGNNQTDYRLYSHVSKMDRFHHSSLVAGGNIAAAGEWIVIKGRIVLINGCSGHYQPRFKRLLTALRWLSTKGHLTAAVELELFKGREAIRVPLLDVLNDPGYLQKHDLIHYPG
jgi:hypothetical protein